MSSSASDPPKGRLRQLVQAFKVTRQRDRFLPWILLAWFVGVGGVLGALSYIFTMRGTLGIIIAVVFGVLTGVLAALIVFGRRAERAAYAQVEGQVGAAAGALQMLKKGWHVKPAVGFTKQQDVVHRVLGRPGVILIGEGQHNRVHQLLATERRKHERIVGEDIPIVELTVGNGKNDVPLPKLIKTVRKLPKNIKPAQITPVLSKLRAVDAMRPSAPMPKGPVPTSMKGQRRAMRG